MKIFCVSGKAQHGKDTFAELIKEIFERHNKKVLITHFGDLLKYTCSTFFKWNGEKDKDGRTLLQKVGTEKIRGSYPDFWVDYVVKILTVFKNEWDIVIIPDVRFDNEINCFINNGFDTTTVRINRNNYNNGLTPKQAQHPSETSLDKYTFDYNITNNGSIYDFKNEIEKFVIFLFRGGES